MQHGHCVVFTNESVRDKNVVWGGGLSEHEMNEQVRSKVNEIKSAFEANPEARENIFADMDRRIKNNKPYYLSEGNFQFSNMSMEQSSEDYKNWEKIEDSELIFMHHFLNLYENIEENYTIYLPEYWQHLCEYINTHISKGHNYYCYPLDINGNKNLDSLEYRYFALMSDTNMLQENTSGPKIIKITLTPLTPKKVIENATFSKGN